MITHIRTAIVKDDLQTAMTFAVKVSEYLHKTFGQPTSVNSRYGGNPFSICWITVFEDLAALEGYHNKVMNDPKYIALLTEGIKYFVEGSAQDAIWSAFSTHR